MDIPSVVIRCAAKNPKEPAMTPRTRTARPALRGFSLSELVVAVLLLSTLSVVLVGVIPAAVLGVRSAGYRATAATLARQTLEDLRRGGLGRLEAADLPNVTVNNVVYTRRVELAAARAFDGGSPLALNEAREVRCVITWMDRGIRKGYCGSTVFHRR